MSFPSSFLTTMPRLLPAPKLAHKEKLFLIKPCCIIHIYSLRIVNVWDTRSIAQRFVDDCVLAVKLKNKHVLQTVVEFV